MVLTWRWAKYGEEGMKRVTKEHHHEEYGHWGLRARTTEKERIKSTLIKSA